MDRRKAITTPLAYQWLQACLYLGYESRVDMNTECVQILEGSPWVQSRPLHVLALMAPNSDTALTYTLRTRVQRPNFSRDMDKVLPGGLAQLLSCAILPLAMPARQSSSI